MPLLQQGLHVLELCNVVIAVDKFGFYYYLLVSSDWLGCLFHFCLLLWIQYFKVLGSMPAKKTFGVAVGREARTNTIRGKTTVQYCTAWGKKGLHYLCIGMLHRWSLYVDPLQSIQLSLQMHSVFPAAPSWSVSLFFSSSEWDARMVSSEHYHSSASHKHLNIGWLSFSRVGHQWHQMGVQAKVESVTTGLLVSPRWWQGSHLRKRALHEDTLICCLSETWMAFAEAWDTRWWNLSPACASEEKKNWM